MNVLFHANASKSIGAGHLMRSLALAQGLAEDGHGASLITGKETAPGLIAPRKRLGATVIVDSLQGASADLAKKCIALAEKSEAAWIVLDGYGFDSVYQSALREAGYRVLVIDDMAHQPFYAADILLNQNLHAGNLHYSCGPETILLLGTRYALIRREFLPWKAWKRFFPLDAQKVLVTLGGGHFPEVLEKIVGAIRSIQACRVEAVVIAGSCAGDLKARIRSGGRETCRFRFLKNTKVMARRMASADVAVSAGGSTCWELACMGLPSVVGVLSEDQRGVAQSLEERGTALNLGWFDRVNQKDIANALVAVLSDVARRKTMSLRGREMVDGLGASRVVERMVRIGGCEEERRPSAQPGGAGSPG